MFKNIFKILGIFIISILGGVLGSQIFLSLLIKKPLFYQLYQQSTTTPSATYVVEKKEIIIQENTALKNAIEKVEKTIVGIRTKTKSNKILEGSGLIITSDGLIITLADLVPQNSEIKIFLQEKILSGQVLKRDLKQNLALIKIEEKNLPTAGFADFEKIKLGERIFLIGKIFEKTSSISIVNEGIIKNFNQDSIQTNIIENISILGSTLFDIEGNILGLNTINKKGEISSISVLRIKSFTGF